MLIGIRFHGRGGQGAVTASKLLVEAAKEVGYYSQSMPFFGAERRGAPVVSFTRISDEPIYEMSQVYHPNIVVVLDPLIMKIVDIFAGVKEGGWIVANTTRRPDDFLFNQEFLNVVTVDSTGIAIKNELLVAGMPVVNTPMLGALLHALLHAQMPLEIGVLEGIVASKFGKEGEKNVRAIRDAYESAEVKLVKGLKKREYPEKRKIKVEFPISTPSEGVAGKTKLWRDFRPEIDYERCNDCLSCWLHCPESAIRLNDRVEIDYEYCKGCLVCASVCPKKAVRSMREVFADV
jgi:pyruvate ferredoxin oxidoreductase gamma subunit